MDDNKGNLVFLPNSNQRQGDPLFFDAQAHHKTLCRELATAHDLNAFNKRILGIVNRLGFSDFIFIRLERVWQPGSERGLLHSLPKEMLDEYQENFFYNHDLLLSYGKVNTQPIFGSQIYGYVDDAPFEMELTTKNRQLRKFYRRHHYSEHLVVPSAATNGSGNVQLILTTSGKSAEDMQSTATPVIPICRALCKAVDSVSTSKFRSSFIDKKDAPLLLNPKPLAMLQALANTDSSITHIAESLCISAITAHQHVATARKALGVSTNIGAIVKAVKAGLIQIE
jgi:Autoinducer binding domain